LETPGGLKIQTIHAFCERLLARFPLEAGVAPGFDIADEARAAELLARARARAALADDAPQGAFLRFAERLHGEALDRLFDRLAPPPAAIHRFAKKHPPSWAPKTRTRHGVRQDAAAFCAAFVARQDWSALKDAAGVLATGGKSDNAAAE